MVPFISQMPTLPLVSRQRMSALPSPLKSRCPTIDHVVGTLPKILVCAIEEPFISHAPTLPELSRQSTLLALPPVAPLTLGMPLLPPLRLCVIARLHAGNRLCAVRPLVDRPAPCGGAALQSWT